MSISLFSLWLIFIWQGESLRIIEVPTSYEDAYILKEDLEQHLGRPLSLTPQSKWLGGSILPPPYSPSSNIVLVWHNPKFMK